MRGGGTRIVSVALVGLVLAVAGCRRLNASHCGNQQGDATCEQRDATAPYCDLCEAANDGCVASEPQCVADDASTGAEPSTGIASTIGETTAVDPTDAADGSSTSMPATCGNGVIEEGEACDGTMLPEGTADCTAMELGEGMPGCLPDCSMLDYSVCPDAAECGNGELGVGEQCDGKNLDGQTCDHFMGRTGDGLMCNASCMFDLSGCDTCRENGESCNPDTEMCCDDGDVCANSILGGVRCCAMGTGECLLGSM